MDGLLRTERVVLLALVTLLGSTLTLVAAAAALVITIAAALLVCGVALLLRPSERISETVRWSILISVGFGVSWILGTLTPYVAPVPDRVVLYLQLAGVAPIVFIGVRTGTDKGDSLPRDGVVTWAHFAIVLLAVGAFREIFGRGTLVGNLVLRDFTIPADFFAAPMGAFLVLGAIVLGTRVVSRMLEGGQA